VAGYSRSLNEDAIMTIGLCFWILMLIWLVFGLASWNNAVGPYGTVGNTLLLFVLPTAAWAGNAFGAPLHG